MEELKYRLVFHESCILSQFCVCFGLTTTSVDSNVILPPIWGRNGFFRGPRELGFKVDAFQDFVGGGISRPSVWREPTDLLSCLPRS